MKGLLQMGKLAEDMPLVRMKLKHAEATRQTMENYQHLEGENLLHATIEENVLTQIENLRTYPVIRAKPTKIKSISMPGCITLKWRDIGI